MSNVTVSKIKLNGTIYEIVDKNNKEQIDALSARIDSLGSGGISSESDPTVPAWAKASTKPTYTWTEIQEKPTLFSGDYNDLTNKPTIPSLDGLVTQSQLDAIIARLEALEAKPTIDGDTLDFGEE